MIESPRSIDTCGGSRRIVKQYLFGVIDIVEIAAVTRSLPRQQGKFTDGRYPTLLGEHYAEITVDFGAYQSPHGRMRPASRSQGSRRAPAAQWVRFTEDWNDRLHGAARYEGKTIAGFLRDAATDHIEKVEETIRAKKEARAARQRAAPRRLVRGLGIRDLLDPRSAERQQQELPAPPSPLVVVKVQPAGAAADPGELRRSERYVADGPRRSRDRGWEEVIRKIVASVVGDEQQAERLVDALVDAVEALESASGGDAPPSRVGDGPGVLEILKRLT